MKTKAACTLKSQGGFSLIELMIVVAIIGILATIAIPNFTRFQVKARQAEVKNNLSAIYSAEKAFQAEWNGYWADFRDIGFQPEGRLRYNVGFTGNLAANTYQAAGLNPSTAGNTAAGIAFNTTVQAARGTSQLMVTGMPFQAAAAAGACQASLVPTTSAAAGGAQFRASGNSTAAALGSTNADVWTMDHTKNLCNNASGI